MEGITFFDGLMEQVEFEHKLFESVLKVNFKKTQILKEDGQVDSQKDPDKGPDVNPAQADQDTDNEATKKKIGEKIAEKIHKIIEWFKNTAFKIADKIKNIIYSDNKIIKKYNEVLTTKADALKGFPGIPNFRAAKVDGYKLPTEEVQKLITNNSEKYFSTIEECKNVAKMIEDQCAFAFEDEVELWNKDGSAKYNWANAFASLSNDRLSADLMVVAKSIAAKEDSFKQKFVEAYYKGMTDAAFSVAGVDKDNQLRKDTVADAGEFAHYITTSFKTFLTTYAAYFKALRRACITCGTYAVKNSVATSTEAKQEATTLAFLADLQNEQFLDESFSFA